VKVLVSGGGGYIGSVLVRRLASSGIDVTVLDRFTFGKGPLEPLISENKITIIDADAGAFDQQLLNSKTPDAIFHLAALSSDAVCNLDPKLAIETNVGCTKHMAQIAKNFGVKKFILFSSASVYGIGEELALTEESALNPLSIYANSKVQAEEILHRYQDSNFLPIILRLGTVFGLSHRMRYDLAINAMTLNALSRRRISVLGAGKEWRPFIHVEDVAALCEQLLHEPLAKTGGQTFNVGADELNYQIVDLAKMIATEISGTELDYEPGNSDIRDYHISFEKIRSSIGFKPSHDIVSGVRQIASHIKKHSQSLDKSERVFSTTEAKSSFLTPAILGGDRVRKEFLPFSLPLLGLEEEEAVLATLRSGWLTTGSRTKLFEEKLADYLGVKNSLALSSCTAALHLALAVLNVQSGDEVIVPSLTFCSTVNVIEHTGAKPVFVDVDPQDLNLNAQLIEQLITSKTKAIMVVHMAGYPCDLNLIQKLADKHKLPIIEDAAHAIGSSYTGRKIGSFSDFTCFSFYPIKNMTTIEGGAIIAKNPEHMDRLRRLALHGMDKSAWHRYGAGGTPFSYVEEPGFKYNMTDVQAAVGIHQLDRLDGFNSKRQQMADYYDNAFRALPALSRPQYDFSSRTSNNHLYILKLQLEHLSITRNQLLESIKLEGIGSGIHFWPVHLQPYYKTKYPEAENALPETNKLAETIFSLPLYPKMSTTDIFDCVRALEKLLTYHLRVE
jgi:dTDP-4-amino-4,6-dideoxygalactose transaminase/nucleoside-diphosphate-sugar epimerase